MHTHFKVLFVFLFCWFVATEFYTRKLAKKMLYITFLNADKTRASRECWVATPFFVYYRNICSLRISNSIYLSIFNCDPISISWNIRFQCSCVPKHTHKRREKNTDQTKGKHLGGIHINYSITDGKWSGALRKPHLFEYHFAIISGNLKLNEFRSRVGRWPFLFDWYTYPYIFGWRWILLANFEMKYVGIIFYFYFYFIQFWRKYNTEHGKPPLDSATNSICLLELDTLQIRFRLFKKNSENYIFFSSSVH